MNAIVRLMDLMRSDILNVLYGRKEGKPSKVDPCISWPGPVMDYDGDELWALRLPVRVSRDISQFYRCPVCGTFPALCSTDPKYACTACYNKAKFGIPIPTQLQLREINLLDFIKGII